MYLSTVVTLALVVTVSCDSGHSWHPPRRNDRRGPCPMLNSLANHGFISRDGRDISVEELVDGLTDAINLDTETSRKPAELALTTSTTGNRRTMNLDDLDEHGVIAHDASFSRDDIFFGDSLTFNEVIWDDFVDFFRGDIITIEEAAEARMDRIRTCERTNPEFTFGEHEDLFSRREVALILRVFGGRRVEAPTEWINILFREERIPYREGFRRSRETIPNDEIADLADRIAELS